MIRGKTQPCNEYLIYQYMNKFKLSYREVLEEPAEAFWQNIHILGTIEKEKQRDQREQELKSKHSKNGRY
jgi:hypothetical protein